MNQPHTLPTRPCSSWSSPCNPTLKTNTKPPTKHLISRFDLVRRSPLRPSADTFIYVGDLDRCFSQAKVKLVEGGLFAFSVELLSEADGGAAEEEAATSTTGAGFKLQRSGRYGHTPDYIAGLAARFGMVVELRRDIVVRKEQATPIRGLVYVLRRTQEG